MNAPREGKPKAAGTSTSATRPEVFRRELGALEELVDTALRDELGQPAAATELAPSLSRAAEAALAFSAGLGRILSGEAEADPLVELGLLAPADGDAARDRALARVVDPLSGFLFERWWRVAVAGLDSLPSERPLIFIANGRGLEQAYAALMIREALAGIEWRARTMVDPSALEWPILGELLPRLGALPASRPRAMEFLEQGGRLLCFPEGGSTEVRPSVGVYEMSVGYDPLFATLACESGAVVVPVAVVGAQEAHPVLARVRLAGRPLGLDSLPLTPTFPWLGVGGLLPLPSRWRIEFGEPIRPEVGEQDDFGEVAVRRLSDLLEATAVRRGAAFVEVGRRGRSGSRETAE